MALAEDLLETARRSLAMRTRRPRQADLRRTVSTLYYALFHALAADGADLLIGATRASRSNAAWAQAYRALDHGLAKQAARRAQNLGFPTDVVVFSLAFIKLQEERHRADYDPLARFALGDARALASETEAALSALRSASATHRRAFAALALFRHR